jgi:NAD(P)-dependent dehydrogenase (short-subunit alcohol dehydrogenase family)
VNALPLAGRHAVVTGAGRGIGAAIAAALAAQGARLTLLGRTRAALAETAAQLAAQGATHIATCDVADEQQVAQAIEGARRDLGPIDILVNNAGQAASAPFLKTDTALWQSMLAVNLTGTFLCTRACLPDMIARGHGRIVNIASVAGLTGHPYISAYCASKHGVIGLTRALASELAPKDITVNAVCPGYTDTDMVRAAVANIRAKTGRSEAEAIAAVTERNPQRRLVSPAEIAATVLWLVLPGAESVTGQSITLAGGEIM